MSNASTHLKLGVFSLLAILAVVAVAFGLGIRGVKSDTVTYHTYFDESVQGLDVGAPVEFRGVPIGSATDIRIAPDRKLVDVTLGVNRVDAQKLHLAERGPEIRAQLGTQGITGVKLVDIDFFDPKAAPPPTLSFPPAKDYIPARPSLVAGLLDDLAVVGQRLPALIDVTIEALTKLEHMLDEVQGARVPDRVVKILDTVSSSAADLDVLLRHVDRARVPEKAGAALDSLGAALGRVGAVVEEVGGDAGLVASTRRATDSIGDLGRRTVDSTGDLDRTLRDLDEAAAAIRALAESVDRDPDMLLKGRAKTREP